MRGQRPKYPDLKVPVRDWYHASGSLSLRNRIFTQHLYPPFVRMAEFHFNNSRHPDYVDADTVVGEVTSHLYEALLTFDPRKLNFDNPWYYFNLCARNATYRCIQVRCREVMGSKVPAQATAFNLYISDLDGWDQYLVQDEPNEPEESALFEACQSLDPVLVGAIIDLDDDDFSNKGVKQSAKLALASGSVGDYVSRVREMRNRFR